MCNFTWTENGAIHACTLPKTHGDDKPHQCQCGLVAGIDYGEEKAK